MKKVFTFIIALLATISVSAQVHQFTVTHESKYELDLETETVKGAIYERAPVNYTLSLDLNDNYLKITGENKSEHYKIANMSKQDDGLIGGFGIDVNRPTLTVAVAVGKGMIGIIYPQLGISTVYFTKKK